MFRSAVFIGLLVSGCASPQTVEPPSWFSTPPTGAQALYFVGDADLADSEHDARRLAVEHALAELAVYCGATVDSKFSSNSSETNGNVEQKVDFSVQLHGASVSIQKAVIKQTRVQKSTQHGYRAFALLAWPKSEYARLMQVQVEQALAAAERLEQARVALAARDFKTAEPHVQAAEDNVKQAPAALSLSHPKYANVGSLQAAVREVQTALTQLKASAAKTTLLGMRCRKNNADIPCETQWVDAFAERITASGHALLRTSSSPQALRPEDREASRMVWVQLQAKTQSEGPFTYARCHNTVELWNTADQKASQTHAFRGAKTGHPKASAAMNKSCLDSTTHALKWLETELAQ